MEMASSYELLLRWFRNRGDQELMDWTWKGIIVFGVILAIMAEAFNYRVPYGRYSELAKAGVCSPKIPARVSWFFQELPSVLAPFFFLVNVGGAQVSGWVNPNVVLLGMFLVHYIQRLDHCRQGLRSQALSLSLLLFQDIFVLPEYQGWKANTYRWILDWNYLLYSQWNGAGSLPH